MAFEQKKCIPCEGNITPLTQEEASRMIKEVEGWELIDNYTRIQRKYTFSNFRKALAFVNKAGAIAEEEKHHPDISFGWGYATITLQTHAINGLHENDFIIAAKLNQI